MASRIAYYVTHKHIPRRSHDSVGSEFVLTCPVLTNKLPLFDQAIMFCTVSPNVEVSRAFTRMLCFPTFVNASMIFYSGQL